MPPAIADHEAGYLLTNLMSGQSLPQPERTLEPRTQQMQQAVPILPPLQGPLQGSSVTFKASPSIAGVKRSRSRPTKSCEQCRKKKLKCNRELPCSQCLKGSRDGSQCHFEYGNEGGEKAAGRDEVMERGLKRFRVDMEESRALPVQKTTRVDEIQRTGYTAPSHVQSSYVNVQPRNSAPPGGMAQGLQKIQATYSPSSPSNLGLRTPSTPKESQRGYNSTSTTLGRLRFHPCGSRFIGSNDGMAMADHFPDAKIFLGQIMRNPGMNTISQELFEFRKAYHPMFPRCKGSSDVPEDYGDLDAKLLSSIPDESHLLMLQESYVATWETISRVLHVPTFAKDSMAIVALRAAGQQITRSDRRYWVVPQIVCVVAIASRLSTSGSKLAQSPDKLSDDQTTKDIRMVKAWLERLRGKSNMNYNVLQVRVLLLLASEANLLPSFILWRESGDVVRRAMTMGLHQDPESSDEMPKFLKEMRRKLWLTIVELDVKFSLKAGMPTAVSSSLINPALINVDDYELVEDMQQYPMNNHTSVWTQALPQIALVASIRERIDAANFLGGNVNIERDADSIMHHAIGLENALKSLPAQFRPATKAGNVSNRQIHRLFTSIMLDISIRRPLLALYRTLALSPLSTRYPDAMAGATRNSLAILDHLDALDPTIGDLSTVKTRDYLNMFHALCKLEIMEAAMVLCYGIGSFNSDSRLQGAVEDENTNDQQYFLEGKTKQSLTRVVENTLKSLMQRLGEFGGDLKEALTLSVLLQSVRTDGTEEEKREMMWKGAERIMFACREILPSIQDAARQNTGKIGRCQPQMSPAPITPRWEPPHVDNSNSGIVGMPSFDYFNLAPEDEIFFQNFDVGFTDWDANNSWP